MQNRRQYYRHSIRPEDYRKVTLRAHDGTQSVSGKIVNLSIGGLCVLVDAPHAGGDETWIATFTLEVDAPPLTIPVERVYARNDNEGYCGFRFLPRARSRDPEEQERLIWRFLLEEQRRERKDARQRHQATG